VTTGDGYVSAVPLIRVVCLTREATFANSLSALTRTDCTRNLSRHLASGAGSSFIACRRTVVICQRAAGTPWGRAYKRDILCTSTSLPGSMRPLLGLTQYLEHYYQPSEGGRWMDVGPYCFGAVVLTCSASVDCRIKRFRSAPRARTSHGDCSP
jgi:hypothetical protein